MKTLKQRLCEKYQAGEITLLDMARELAKAGYTNFTDVSFAKRTYMDYLKNQ